MEYLFWKLIHITSVVMFLGNIITGLFWAARAHKTKDFNLIASTFRSIISSDRYFTIPGVIGITFSGIVAAINGGFPILGTGWILWGIILFSISGIAFSIYVAPLQKKIFNFANSHDFSEKDWEVYKKLYKQWEVWGFIATLTPVGALIIMVLKPFLPGL